MNPFSFAYTELLFRPLFNLMVAITNVLPSHGVGVAVILVTLAIRLILLPSSLHHARQLHHNQSKLTQLKSELEAIKKKHKDDKAKQAQATMDLYKKAGINPAQGCLPLLIQLPILIALYRVFLQGLTADSYHYLYSFVAAPASINLVFLGITLDRPSLIFAIIAGIAQFVQMRWFSPPPAATPGADQAGGQMMSVMQKNMTYIFPAMTVFIALRLPAALSLYWVTTTIFATFQQYVLKRSLHLTTNPPPI